MKVGLLGDSIRQIGYGTVIQEYLGKDIEVFQPEDNCRFSKYTMRMIFDYYDKLKDCDVIHWNNGHWDICNLFGDGAFTPEEEYVSNMLYIAKKLKEITPKVIFATTTPVRKEHPHNDNTLIVKYNEIIVPKLKEMGFAINDLHTLVNQNVEEYIRKDDMIHLTEKGIKVCAEQVAMEIKKMF